MSDCKKNASEFVLAEMTEFNADSVEWCPIPQFSQFLACGTYHLNESSTGGDDTQTRNGNVVLYELSPDIGYNLRLEKADLVDSGGVLDMKWYPELLNDTSVLAVACSSGKILLLKMAVEEGSTCLQPLTSSNLSIEAKKMILSLDWSCQKEGSVALIASDTLGGLNFMEVRESEISVTDSWNAHSFEAWVAAFDYYQPHIIYSGGDDCCFKCWDNRSLPSAVFVKKRHSMGVTSISKSKINEHLLVTGSYDENVILWDVRSMTVPLSEISLNGGIWRLKWHPTNPEYLLSASMHNGFHFLSVTDGILTLKTHYDKHESLAYGVDWSQYKEQESQGPESCIFNSIVASCSFYDKLLHVWRIKL